MNHRFSPGFATAYALVAGLLALVVGLATPAGAVPTKGATEVEVRLRGTTGTEMATLQVGGVELFSGQVSSDWMIIEASLSSQAAGSIEVHFTNDLTSEGGDRSIEVDYLALGDQRIAADSPGVYSEGAYNAPNGCSPGFVQSSLLACNGKFTFGTLDETGTLTPPVDPHGNQRGLPLISDGEIDVVARGHFGGERFEVRVGDTLIGEAAATRYWRTYRFDVPSDVTVDEISVSFTSDFWAATPDGDTSFDSNLDVDYIAYAGVELQAEDAWSTGTYVAGEGCVPGFKKSQTLHCNGMLLFATSPASTVDAE